MTELAAATIDVFRFLADGGCPRRASAALLLLHLVDDDVDGVVGSDVDKPAEAAEEVETQA